MKAATSATDVSAMTEDSDFDSLDLTPSGGTPMNSWLLCLRPMQSTPETKEIEEAVVPRGIPEESTESTSSDDEANLVDKEVESREISLPVPSKMAEPLTAPDLFLAAIWIVFSLMILHGHKIELVQHFESAKSAVSLLVASLGEKISA